MRALILGGNPGFWHAPERAYERNIISGIEAWVFALDGDHANTLDATPELVNQYDLIIGNTNRGPYRKKLLELQRSRKKGIRWVTLIEACATEYLTLDQATKELFDGSDLVNVINRHTLDYFRACTTTRCEYIGIPYPALGIRKSFPRGTARDVWIPSNLYNTNASWSSAMAALPVTRKFGTECHGFYRKETSGSPRSFFSFRQKRGRVEEPYSELLKEIQFHNEMNMPEYFKTLAETAFAFVNLDHRYTWSRDVLDCAALGIPCIATASTTHVDEYFPELKVSDEFAVHEAAELLERLYSDQAFYKSCSEIPIEHLEPLSHQNMKQKLLAMLEV